MNPALIRNFSIIAHVDHGKSTLADRLLESTGALSSREMEAQVLDQMDLERERGITIKAHAVRLSYQAKDGQTYVLNLIDTPGHVDFSYEVSRSLAACEGALLVVDAAQGVEAQTVANAYLALEHELTLVPIINKIDLPNADPDRVKAQLRDVIGLDSDATILASAKEGIGTEEILEAIVNALPPPQGRAEEPLKALIVDSWFDSYQGVIVLIRVFSGVVRRGMRIRLMATEKEYEVTGLGVFTPKPCAVDELAAGEVGFLMAGLKQVSDTQVGDTITTAAHPAAAPLPGYKEVKPMVFCGLYPADDSSYEDLRDALEKLRLNDSAFTFEPETSLALGFGFRCGFLGLLHMEIVQERLEREFDLTLVSTAPTVVYRVTKTDGTISTVDNPAKLPAPQFIATIEEPFILGTILTPPEFLGAILQLAQEKRGIQRKLHYPEPKIALLTYDFPLNEMVFDFYDRLKSVSRGYASFDYEFLGYRGADLVKLDILINGEPVDALSSIIHRDKAYFYGRDLVKKMRQVIPRQLFEVAIQAAIGSRVIARETVVPLRKNVTAKCYGGDITRKRKLLEKQKEGKRRMKRVGRVEIPQEAFVAVLQVGR
ncbi:MAG TPA: translation elongation factor 4 [Candidatus Tectomicrobia bacterium]|nr:translation elongation factor 4 [Candidatus Tectomicrobia bacterium]